MALKVLKNMTHMVISLADWPYAIVSPIHIPDSVSRNVMYQILHNTLTLVDDYSNYLTETVAPSIWNWTILFNQSPTPSCSGRGPGGQLQEILIVPQLIAAIFQFWHLLIRQNYYFRYLSPELVITKSWHKFRIERCGLLSLLCNSGHRNLRDK